MSSVLLYCFTTVADLEEMFVLVCSVQCLPNDFLNGWCFDHGLPFNQMHVMLNIYEILKEKKFGQLR